MMNASLYALQATLLRWMGLYRDVALWIERHGPATDKIMHLNAGLIIWVATVMMRGRRWGNRHNLWPLVLLMLGRHRPDEPSISQIYARPSPQQPSVPGGVRSAPRSSLYA